MTGLDADLEAGPLSAVVFSVSPHAELILDGEAFESLSKGRGGSVAVAGHFDDRYAARLRVAVTRQDEANQFVEDVTTTVDSWLELRWLRRAWGIDLEAGPTVGYVRVSRPVYVDPIQGFLAGLGVGAAKPLVGGVEVALGLHANWSSFGRPSISGTPPAGFDSDVAAKRVWLSVGLGYRWSRD